MTARRAATVLGGFTAGLVVGAGTVLVTLARMERGYQRGRR